MQNELTALACPPCRAEDFAGGDVDTRQDILLVASTVESSFYPVRLVLRSFRVLKKCWFPNSSASAAKAVLKFFHFIAG
jgi:hypothetical protein